MSRTCPITKKGSQVGGGYSNRTRATEYNPTNEYAGGLQLGYSFDTGSAYLNTIISEDFYQVDLTTGVDVSEDFYLGLNATVAQDAFAGVAGYFQYTFNEACQLGTRIEYFEDKGVGAVGTNENVLDVTLTGKYTVGNLTIIPEIRVDKVSAPMFADDTEMKEDLSSFVLAIVYGF